MIEELDDGEIGTVVLLKAMNYPNSDIAEETGFSQDEVLTILLEVRDEAEMMETLEHLVVGEYILSSNWKEFDGDKLLNLSGALTQEADTSDGDEHLKDAVDAINPFDEYEYFEEGNDGDE